MVSNSCLTELSAFGGVYNAYGTAVIIVCDVVWYAGWKKCEGEYLKSLTYSSIMY